MIDEADDTPIFDNPAMEKTFDAVCDAFFETAVAGKLTQGDALRVLASATAALAANVYFGLDPDTPIEDRPTDEKDTYRAAFIEMIEEDLADVLAVPFDLSAEDDEEVQPDMDLMPGLNRVH